MVSACGRERRRGWPSSSTSSTRRRAAGLELSAFVGGWIDGDQMDLDLPAPFLQACGNAGLAISIVTND
jgi:hypothetical protein